MPSVLFFILCVLSFSAITAFGVTFRALRQAKREAAIAKQKLLEVQRSQQIQDRVLEESDTSILRLEEQLITFEAQQQQARQAYEQVNNDLQHERSEKAALESRFDQLKKERDERIRSKEEDEKFTQDLLTLNEELERETQTIKTEKHQLEQENKRLKKRDHLQHTSYEITLQATEKDLYPQERIQILIKVFKEALSQMIEAGTRREHVISDIVRHNRLDQEREQLESKIKNVIGNYTGMDAKTRKMLNDLGFEITESKHYKLTYCADNRYVYILPKTPGDHRRGGKNSASEMLRKFF